MQLTQQYSSADEKVSDAKKKKNSVTPLAQATFDAFEPFINVFDPGSCWDGPLHSITKEDWELFRRHKAGEKPLTRSNGWKFNPYNDVIRNIYSAEHVQSHFEGGTSYYTSGKKGLGLLYLDIDAHKSWQTDQIKARFLLERLFPFAYFRASRRGQNGYLKIRYSSIEEFNQTAAMLQAILRRLFLHFQILCDIEVKGTITQRLKSGLLAKLPFHARQNEPDSWNEQQLELFVACQVVSARRIERIAERATHYIDEEKVATCTARRQKLLEWSESRAHIVQQFRDLGYRGTDEEVFLQAKELRDQYLKDRSANSLSTGETPEAQTHTVVDESNEPTAVPVDSSAMLPRVTNQRGTGEGDAFARNQKDLAPFVRNFYKKYRTLPKLEDALTYLHDNKLFSGDWTDNEHRRAKRVSQILQTLFETFDPKLLRTGESKPVSLSVEKFRWWVKSHQCSGMTARVAQLKKFEPVTMTAPVQDVSVPADFIETFLVVADFCLNQDPLENKAVPTNRFKKIWKMVTGGASWNQTYFQVVRDRLDNMGIVHIFDRQHDKNKAWRWKAGSNFPAQNWKEHQRKLSERMKGFSLGVSYSEFITNKNIEKNEDLHNTLYQTDARFLRLQGRRNQESDIRPPPD